MLRVGKLSITIPMPKRLLRYYRKKVPKWLRFILYWLGIVILASIGDLALLAFLSALTAQNLINWNTVVSFAVVEVLAAVIAKMFKIGAPSDAEEKNEKIRLAASRARFSHLQIVSLENEGYADDYPNSHYRIVNTRTKFCYWVPSYLESLVEEETIFQNEIVLKDETQWKNYLQDNGIRDKTKFPSSAELGIWTSETTQEKEEALYRDYII